MIEWIKGRPHTQRKCDTENGRVREGREAEDVVMDLLPKCVKGLGLEYGNTKEQRGESF